MQVSEYFGDVFANRHHLGCVFDWAFDRLRNGCAKFLLFFLADRNEGEDDRNDVLNLHELLFGNQVKAAFFLDGVVEKLSSEPF